jgi:hypothetical protein
MKFKNKYFEIYEIKLSNDNVDWRNLIISGTNFDITNIPVLPTDLTLLNNIE